MHGVVGKSDGNFGAREVGHALCAGSGQSAVLATHFVVVGQGPEFDPIGFGAFGQDFGGEGAVRDNGMAVQVSVHDVFHSFILGPQPADPFAVVEFVFFPNSPARGRVGVTRR